MTPTPSASEFLGRVCRSADSHVRDAPEGSVYEIFWRRIHLASEAGWRALAISRKL